MCSSNDSFSASSVSPDGRNKIRLWLRPLAYAVYRDDVEVVRKTKIDLRIGGESLSERMTIPRITITHTGGKLSTPIYKKREISLSANLTDVDFGDWSLQLVARDDGVAYRFALRFDGRVRIDHEDATLRLPIESNCTVNYGENYGNEETVPITCEARAIETGSEERKYVYLPMVYSFAGKTVAVTEADVCDYPILNFKRVKSADADALALEAEFARWPRCVHRAGGWDRKTAIPSGGRWIVIDEHEDYLVETEGSRALPWRVFILVDDEPSKLCEADIVYALARPAEGDFSWVKPGKVAWDWWNAWDNQGESAGCNTATYKRFIDFAAAGKVEYVILDEGWSETLNIWRFSAAVDVPELIRYAEARGVGIILWMAWAQIVGDEANVAEHFAKLGAKGFKVDFMDRGDAECERFLWKFAQECAKRKMLVDYHGAHRPTGMSRTFPNVLNYEGVHGLENMKFYRNEDFMSNDVNAFYLRMTAGPLDYTPGAMDNYPIGELGGDKFNPGSFGTRCRQMAMMTLYEAPLQMLCDSPSKYERNRECFEFMAGVPVVWDSTLALGGAPEAFAVVARRKGEAWYVAGITDSHARDWTLDTAFLGGGEWLMECFTDAPDAEHSPTHYIHRRNISFFAGERFTFHMAPGGAFTMRITK